MSKLLSMMMGSGKKVEFKNYVYAIDNAYIETDIKLNENYKISIKGKTKVSVTSQIIFFMAGSGSVSYWNGTRAMLYLEGSSRYCYLNNLSIGNLYSINSGTTDNVRVFTGTNGAYANDFTISLSRTNTKTNYNLFLFFNNVESIYSNDNLKIKLIEIKDQNDNLIHEIKPAIVNGESGVYDTVTETFYGNANSVGSLVCE